MEKSNGIGKKNNGERILTVQKSNPLLSLWQSDLSLAEFKILDAYLAKIDSHVPQKREIIFEKGELEKLLNVQKINLSSLKKRLRHLLTGVVEIRDTNIERGFVLISLFERAFAEQDQESGLWKIKLKCTEDAMTYIFNIENLGYLRYKLSSVVSLKSRYSYIMFLYLEKNRYRQTWTEDLQKIRDMLCCNAAVYDDYKYFNKFVLKRCKEEIIEKTKCRYLYTPVRNGRSVVRIRFEVEFLNEKDIQENSTEEDILSLVAPGLKKETYDNIRDLLEKIPDTLLPWAEDDVSQKMNYLRIKYRAMMSGGKNITSKDAYLIKMIENDIQTYRNNKAKDIRKGELLPSIFD